MQNFVILILRILILVCFLLTTKDLSVYLVTRQNEDTLSKQLPKNLSININTNKSDSKTQNTEIPVKQINVSKYLSKKGVSVILIKNLKTKQSWGFNYVYRDSNSNRVMDIQDVGYITPGSTIKVILAYCLYKTTNPSVNVESVIKKALVISDNTSANKMIDLMGGVSNVQNCINKEGLKNTYINRKFGSNESITMKGCKEGNVYSNCTTATTLIQIMEYLITGNNSIGLYLEESKRKKIISILSLRPKDIGVNKPNDYCAFLQEKGPQKCGVALLDTSISNIAYVPSKNLIVFLGFRGDPIPESQMSNIIQSMFTIGLNAIE